MAKTNKTVIGEIKDICESFDYSPSDVDGSITLEQIQSIISKQLGYITTV